ncbi:MAG TPA: hypothetical protein VMU88_01560 [bacterium]|nr:hypothetical protein [bacterium]
MKSIHRDRACLFSLFAGLLLLFTPSGLWADDTDDISQFLYGRTYFGLLGTSVSFSGSGFGKTALLSGAPYEADLAPSLGQNFGWGAYLGRREGFYAVEVSFWQSVHQASWNGSYPVSWSGSTPYGQTLKGSATLNSVNIDFKRYFLTDIPFQPFVGLGVNIPWLTSQDTSSNGDKVGNTTFEGVGFDLGIGAEYYFNTTFSIEGGFYQKWSGFGQYKGVNNVDEQVQNALGNPSSFTTSSLDFYIGTSFGFI